MSLSGISDVSYSDPRRYITVYPIYLESTATIAQGRRVSKSQSIQYCSIDDIVEGSKLLNINNVVVEPNKHYSRNTFDCIGRVKIQIKDSNSKTMYSNINNKQTLLIELCNIIKTINRQQRILQAETELKKIEDKFSNPITTNIPTTKQDKKIKKKNKK